jgi:hypothetical protein
MVVCRFFQQGRCVQGDWCRFEHLISASPMFTFPPPIPATRNVHSYVSTVVGNPSPCVFFQRGTCKYGDSCKHAHDLGTTSTSPPTTVADKRSDVICTFFLRNSCSKGAACPFSHSVGANKTTMETENITVNGQSLREDDSSDPPSSPHHSLSDERTIAGANIIFADGATVSNITLPADFSTVALFDIPAAATPDDVRNTIKVLAMHEDVEILSLKSDPKTSKRSAEVRVNDGGRLCRSIVSVNPELILHGSHFRISPIQLGSSDAGTNRLQLSGVTCTWYNPSRTATLRYASDQAANKAFTKLEQYTYELRGRQPTFTHVRPSSTVRVGNLDILTNTNDLKRYLGHNAAPNIQFGIRSHSMSKETLERRVKNLLEKQGHLTEWTVSPQPRVAKVKAYAKFTNHNEAAQAAQKLDGSQIDPSCNNVLHVQHVISVKLPVSQRVLETIKPQLHLLAETSRLTNHVTIKAYDSLKAYTQIRISGQEKASVARAKTQVEVLLAGTIAHVGKQTLAQKYFFQVASTPFLDEVMKAHGMLVIRDRRKLVLRLYGEANSIDAAQKALESKTAELESKSKEIILDSHSLATAMRGGLQHIIATFGKDNIKLDVTSNPKRVLVNGSERDVELVRNILQSRQFDLSAATEGLSIRKDEDSVCVVCWTPAEEPLETCCGHTYCMACFDSQAISTSDFPVRCLGDSGTCDIPFALPELSRLLTRETFDALLETSLGNFIRAHPKQFQYCSTPDCDRFYRVSRQEDAVVFNCDYCLTSICTACHTGAHAQVTCDEAKAGRDGTDEFAQWKSNNDVRDCPTCAAPIQKSDGCDHMECRSCRAHICWRCMKVFKAGPDVYAHMNEDHNRNWGLGWVPQDFE